MTDEERRELAKVLRHLAAGCLKLADSAESADGPDLRLAWTVASHMGRVRRLISALAP